MPYKEKSFYELCQLDKLVQIRMIQKHVVTAAHEDHKMFKKAEMDLAAKYKLHVPQPEKDLEWEVAVLTDQIRAQRFAEITNHGLSKTTEARKQSELFVIKAISALDDDSNRENKAKAKVLTGLKLLHLFEIAIPGYGSDFCQIISTLNSTAYINSITFKTLMLNLGLVGQTEKGAESIVSISAAEMQVYIEHLRVFLKEFYVNRKIDAGVKSDNPFKDIPKFTLQYAMEKLEEFSTYLTKQELQQGKASAQARIAEEAKKEQERLAEEKRLAEEAKRIADEEAKRVADEEKAKHPQPANSWSYLNPFSYSIPFFNPAPSVTESPLAPQVDISTVPSEKPPVDTNKAKVSSAPQKSPISWAEIVKPRAATTEETIVEEGSTAPTF